MRPDQQRPPESAMRSDSDPLPPLPDGGLAHAMPAWLREEPPAAQSGTRAALDPANLITADDLPDWLRHLSPEHRPALEAPPPVARAQAPPLVAPAAVPSLPASSPATSKPEPVVTSRPAIVPTPAAPMPTPASGPDTARRKAIVAALGFLILALTVVAIVYVKGGL